MVAYIFEIQLTGDGNVPKPETLRMVLPQYENVDIEKFRGVVPDEILSDYWESAKVLPLSAKASAVLSRRCLQNVLTNQGMIGSNLSRQISMILETDVLPAHLHAAVDLIRHFGNFGAHPLTDNTTLTVVEVEAGEAETCLAILKELLIFYFVEPAERDRRLDPLRDKVRNLGKPLLS